MAHLVFVDSTATGLAAFATARRLGDRVTFVRPRDLLFGELLGLSAAKLEAALHHVDRVIEIDALSARTLLDALAPVHAEEPIDALITVSELAVLPVADAAAELGVRANDPDALRTAVYKDRCRAHLDAHGLRSARHARVTGREAAVEAAEEIGYPVVLKACRSAAKQLSDLCADEAELHAFFDAEADKRAAMEPAFRRFLGDGFLVEERLSGPLYSAEVALADGALLPLVLTERTRASHDELVEIGSFMPADLSAADTRAAFEYVERVLASLGLGVGLFHVEIIMTPDGPALVEINPRIMGGTLPQMYGYVADLDPFEVLIAVHAGRPLDPDRLRPRRAAGSLAVGALAEGVAPPDADRRVRELMARYELFEAGLAVQPGQRLFRFADNLTAFGRLGFAAPDADTAKATGRRFIAELEAALGCPMATY